MQTKLRPICQGHTVLHNQTRHRFRHGYAWHIGVLWIELAIPRLRCIEYRFNFTKEEKISTPKDWI